VAKGVTARHAVAVVALRDLGEVQVSVEDAHARDTHQSLGRVQPERCRFPGVLHGCPSGLQTMVQPLLQVGRQVCTQRDGRSHPVLRVLGPKVDRRVRSVQLDIRDRHRSEFTNAQAGQDARLVGKRPLPTHRLKP